MMETYGLVDRTGWAPGPWDGEPDEVTWRALGYACRAMRHPEIGAWAGYVEIPLDHPWFGKFYDRLPDVDVHGGLTFADSIAEGWWIGFDCGHFMDVMPGLDALLVRIGARDASTEKWGTYKTLPYVSTEVGRLLVRSYRSLSDAVG